MNSNTPSKTPNLPRSFYPPLSLSFVRGSNCNGVPLNCNGVSRQVPPQYRFNLILTPYFPQKGLLYAFVAN